ncbi:MAG: transglycosylase SLT domain-containing protein [Chloroflexi bacterium]|nr:transglycosylase SLT domain-containing protein [Chloroflexota bacterium]MBU1751132.1 transglycosylase SLT domain-containing protein [Chloroflexota bacterium]MBU1879512.1 transglycosylase SLT domain-containing protein [Chloroflexota bacterium]
MFDRHYRLIAGLVVIALLVGGELITQAPALPSYPPGWVIGMAQRHGLDHRLVWAIIRLESDGHADLITLHEGGAPDIGLMQVNLDTVHAMSTLRWQTITLEELLDPATNVECGCLILRWRLYEALLVEGWPASDVYGVVGRLAGMTPDARRAVYARALAGYNGGARALQAWPAVPPPIAAYVQAVLADPPGLRW